MGRRSRVCVSKRAGHCRRWAEQTCLGASPVEKPLDPEIRVAEPEVTDVETFVTAVLTGTDDAEVATAAMGIARAKTPHLRVVPEELRSRVEKPRIEPSTAAVPQDPTAARILLQEPKHVVLGLHFLGVGRGRRASTRWSSAAYRGGQSSGGGHCTVLSRHWRAKRQRITL